MPNSTVEVRFKDLTVQGSQVRCARWRARAVARPAALRRTQLAESLTCVPSGLWTAGHQARQPAGARLRQAQGGAAGAGRGTAACRSGLPRPCRAHHPRRRRLAGTRRHPPRDLSLPPASPACLPAPQKINPFGRKAEARPYNIIDAVSGVLKPGRLTLLLGTPGSGRSLLMKALAGRLRHEASLKVRGGGPGGRHCGALQLPAPLPAACRAPHLGTTTHTHATHTTRAAQVTAAELTYNGRSLDTFVPERTGHYVSQVGAVQAARCRQPAAAATRQRGCVQQLLAV